MGRVWQEWGRSTPARLSRRRWRYRQGALPLLPPPVGAKFPVSGAPGAGDAPGLRRGCSWALFPAGSAARELPTPAWLRPCLRRWPSATPRGSLCAPGQGSGQQPAPERASEEGSPLSLPRGSAGVVTVEQRLREAEGSQGGPRGAGGRFLAGPETRRPLPRRLVPCWAPGAVGQGGEGSRAAATRGCPGGYPAGARGTCGCWGSSAPSRGCCPCPREPWVRRDIKAAPAWLISAFPERAAYWNCVRLSGSTGPCREHGSRPDPG